MTCPQHASDNTIWREVGTGRRVCLMAHPRPLKVHRRPMVSRPARVRLPWRSLRMVVGGTVLAVVAYASMVGIALSGKPS